MAPRLGIVDEDLDEEEAPREKKEEVVAQLGPRVIQCPECSFEGTSGEAVGRHIERHRPIGVPVYTARGKLISRVCPKGCGRFFSRPNDITTKIGEEQLLNEIRELKQHIAVCDGSPRLETTKEEEMRKSKEKKPKPARRPADRSRKTIFVNGKPAIRRVEPCPLCPSEKFETPSQRGAHFRHRHPDWKSDPAMNPAAKPPDPADDRLPTVEAAPQEPKIREGADHILEDAVTKLEALIESRRDEAVALDRQSEDFAAGAQDIRNEIVALNKKLDKLKVLGE